MTSILFLVEKIQPKNSDAFITKAKNFFYIFCFFFKSTLNFENFEKKMLLIAYVFPKLPTPKDVIR